MNRLSQESENSPQTVSQEQSFWKRLLGRLSFRGRSSEAVERDYIPYQTCPSCNHTISSQSYICPRCQRDLR